MAPKIVSREVVKPSSSNPNNHPKIHNLSIFDQLNPRIYVPLLFVYASKSGGTDHNHRSSVLKVSLSAALSHYYPLAGRIKDYVTIDCNDEGALFLEARMDCGLYDVLKNPDDKILKVLFPDDLSIKDSFVTRPVAVQATYFQCGGMSVGICLSHKMLDMASMSSFINEWASLAKDSEKEINPEFDLGSLYPPLDLPFLKQVQLIPPEVKDCVLRRVVFYGSKIEKLKDIVADQVPNPTRVEVVASLLYRSAISAHAKAILSSSLKPSVMNLPMSLHTKISPPLSERKIGNLSGMFSVSAREVELGFLVKEFRKAKIELSNSFGDMTNREDLYPLILKSIKTLSEYLNGEHEVYTCTSWCRYPFYESDFGWGKPLWVATVLSKHKNLICLIDTKEGDGIEAFITLEENVMAVFENDNELLSFSNINPSVFDSDPCV